MSIDNVENESDAEQKFIYHILTDDIPSGIGIDEKYILTKKNIRGLEIDKGSSKKIYYPDYIVIINSMPTLVVEAKSPGSNVHNGFREARLYAHELNSNFESGVNPAKLVLASNYEKTLYGDWDDKEPVGEVIPEDVNVATVEFQDLVEYLNSEKLEHEAKESAERHTSSNFYKPKELIGGQVIRQAEMGENEFGKQVAWRHRDLFTPEGREGRRKVVQHAYVRSSQRENHVKPIDRAIRAAQPPSVTDTTSIDQSASSEALVDKLRTAEKETRKGKVENHVLLLVGRAGCGKSTFVDYLREVALPEELEESTIWSHVDLNSAPVDRDRIYDWVTDRIISDLRNKSELDFDKLESIERIYNVEINRLKKGRLERFEEGTTEYKRIIDEKIQELENDRDKKLNAYFRFMGAQQERAPIVVMDNADKRTREEQLLMFEVSRWLKETFRCIVVLPICDKTYDLYKDEPPLDTAIRDLSFRIDAPPFHELIERRIDLVEEEVKKDDRDELYYYTSNGIRVSYSPEEEINFLKSIAKSIASNNLFAEKLISGLAAKNLRKAIDIFLDFCTSGYISEDEITSMRLTGGEYSLTKATTSKVIFRGSKKFYDDSESHVTNLFFRDPSVGFSSHFLRLLILRWLKSRIDDKGPIDLQGFHKAESVAIDLQAYGFEKEDTFSEIDKLLESDCITSEHLSGSLKSTEDLLHISPAGEVHLSILENPYYLSAIAEDTQLSSRSIASNIANRIGNAENNIGEDKYISNAKDFAQYIGSRRSDFKDRTSSFVEESDRLKTLNTEKAYRNVNAHFEKSVEKDKWECFTDNYSEGQITYGRVKNIEKDIDVFVELIPGVDGLVHISQIEDKKIGLFDNGDSVAVKIYEIKNNEREVNIDLLGFTNR